MKHVVGAQAWRPKQVRGAHGSGALGFWSAILFNLSLLLLPIAAAGVWHVIVRDHLYDYAYSDGAARSVRARVEHLEASLFPVDFDRRHQWDELIQTELNRNDPVAARGFLLSARAMLPGRDADDINQALQGRDDDASLERAALNLLTAPTRSHYEQLVPQLSQRAATPSLGGPRDFEILSASMLQETDADPMRFVLAGFGLGLAGDFTPRMQAGAAALIDASRRDEFSQTFGDQISALVSASVSLDTFRAQAAARTTRGVDPSAFAISSGAFRAALDPAHAEAAKAALDQIGIMSEATTNSGAAALLTHARSLRDLPRLRLLAQSAGDRAVSAAKNLPHDGRLVRAAGGTLAFNKDLVANMAALIIAAIAFAFASVATAFQGLVRWIRRVDEGDHHDLLHHIGLWRPH